MENALNLPRILRPNRMKFLGLLGISAAFTVIGIWMISEQPVIGYLCAIFFGLGIPVFIIQLLPNCSYLRLDQEGFTFSSLFRSHSVRWTDVEEFMVVRVMKNKMVAWNYASNYKEQPHSLGMSSYLVGAEAALPDTYGLKAEELAALMNCFRENQNH